MKKRILGMLLILCMLFSNIGSEIAYADENEEVQEQEVQEQEVQEQEVQEKDVYYELKLNELEEQYKIGEIIELAPKLSKYASENDEWIETSIDLEKVSVSLEYDEAVFEAVECESPLVYQLKRLTSVKSVVSVTAQIEEEDGTVYTVTENVEISEIEYKIFFEELREEKTTWIYTDEEEYAIEVNADEIPENIEIEWEILDKETGKKVDNGWYTENNRIVFDGSELKNSYYSGKTIAVKASAYLQETDRYIMCDTELYVRETKVSLPKDMKSKYLIQQTWKCKPKLKVNWECGKYPEEKLVEFNIDNIKSSNGKVISIHFIFQTTMQNIR